MCILVVVTVLAYAYVYHTAQAI